MKHFKTIEGAVEDYRLKTDAKVGKSMRIRIYPLTGGLTKKGRFKGQLSVLCESIHWKEKEGSAPLNVYVVGETFHHRFNALPPRHFQRYTYEAEVNPKMIQPSFYPPPWQTPEIHEEHRVKTTKTPPLTQPYWQELKEKFPDYKAKLAYYHVWIPDSKVTIGGKPL